MPEVEKPPPAPDLGAGDQETMETDHDQSQEHVQEAAGGSDNNAVAPVTGSYAAAISGESNTNSEEVVDVLRIVLKKTKPNASFHLKPKEKAKLVFMTLGVPRTHVVGIDQCDFRTIIVHMNCSAVPWRIAHSVEVRDGLITLPMRMFKRLTKVKLMNVGVQTSNIDVVNMLKKFGTFEETFEVKETRYYEDVYDVSNLTMEEKMLKGVKDGNREVKMYIKKNIPSFCLLENGRRVRVRYPAQPVTCARCHQGIRGCKGGANAAKCEKKGGAQVPLEEFWKILTADAEDLGEESEEPELAGSVLRIEGLGKEAGRQWVREYLAVCLQQYIEDVDLVQSENKLAWEVTGLSLKQISDVLEKVSGTQFKGKTVYCVPIVARPKPTEPPANPTVSSESESGGENSDQEPTENPEEPEATGEPAGDGAALDLTLQPRTEEGGEDDFENVNRREKSAEKKKRREENRKKREKEQEEERLAQLQLIKNVKGGKGNGGKGNTSPAKSTKATRSKRKNQEVLKSPESNAANVAKKPKDRGPTKP